ncbi:hypothetical protein ABZ490_44085 [Streptomyces sp. NPDC005811]|uniref:hypothetical protein n=1 Tax=Streptomyces sp. NPDC005811 TaxID=3154565 RepID=UPI0034109FF2
MHEDRQEYEQILDEALSTISGRHNPEQLRAMALNATALITAAAATEYQHYVRIREEARDRVPVPPSTVPEFVPAWSAHSRSDAHLATPDQSAAPGLGWRLGAALLGTGQQRGRRSGDGIARRRWLRMSYGRRLLAALLGLHVRPEVSGAAGAAGAGHSPRRPTDLRGPALTRSIRHRKLVSETAKDRLACGVAIAAILTPVLCGTAAAIFVLVGYLLKMMEPEAGVAGDMLNVGWIFGAVAGASIVASVVGLMITALRTSGQDIQRATGDELALAHQAWRTALLDRGIMPFLQEAIGAPTITPTPRPSFTVTDFTSPDFGEPEHRLD